MEILKDKKEGDIIKKIDIHYISWDENLKKLINKLKMVKADFKESRDSWNIVNNPNYLILLESLIDSIDRDKLSKKDNEFYFSLLLNIHSRVFSSFNLWLIKWERNKELMKRFLEKIEARLKLYWNWYEKVLKSFNDIITSINNSYKDILNEKENNSEIIWTLILDSITKIEDLDFSFLSSSNALFINKLALNYKIRLEEVIKQWVNQSLNVIIEEKIVAIDKILKHSNYNYINNTEWDNKDKFSNKNVLIDTIEMLIWRFNKLKMASDSVVLDNNFTENLLSTLEVIINNKYFELINSKDIKEDIWYMLLNIAWTREYVPINTHLKKEYSDSVLNNEYIIRSDMLAGKIDNSQGA